MKLPWSPDSCDSLAKDASNNFANRDGVTLAIQLRNDSGLP